MKENWISRRQVHVNQEWMLLSVTQQKRAHQWCCVETTWFWLNGVITDLYPKVRQLKPTAALSKHYQLNWTKYAIYFTMPQKESKYRRPSGRVDQIQKVCFVFFSQNATVVTLLVVKACIFRSPNLTPVSHLCKSFRDRWFSCRQSQSFLSKVWLLIGKLFVARERDGEEVRGH